MQRSPGRRNVIARSLPRLFILALAAAAGGLVRADHGPGSTGASTVNSAETMKEGKFSLGFVWDYTQFEGLNSSEIANMTAKVDGEDRHVDALRWSLLTRVEFAYGVFEDFQLGLSTGWYRGDDLREGVIDDTDTFAFEEHGDVSGWTDMWVNGKYRFLRGPSGQVAVFGGIKLPTGRDDVKSDESGERLEPAVQPGSGAFDFQGGAAYSVWLSERITLDASAAYTVRTENDDFKLGDRIDGGVAAAYRFTEDVKTFPQVSALVEATVRYTFRNVEDDDRIDNSGGTVIFLSPGIEVGMTEAAAFSLLAQIPVAQFLNDEQQDTLFKVIAGLTFTL